VKLEKEFTVASPRERVAALFDDDATYCALLPDTRVVLSRAGVRETVTEYAALGTKRDIRFVFRSRPDGNVGFEKVCDGNVWRSLEGEVLLQPSGAGRTRVVLRMEGRTRAFVPELAIRGPMKDQLEQMASALRERIERA
jgi:hypothetical protein